MAEPIEESPQLKVTFTTTEADDILQLPDTKRQLLVPADLGRHGLSRILNSESMLGTSTIPFDFLVNGAFLRTTLQEYLKSNGLSLEMNITLQYVRSLVPPTYKDTLEHDDWVSGVDVLSQTSPAGLWSADAMISGQDRILSASYDGLLRIWNASKDLLATSPAGSLGGHVASIKSAKFLSSSQIVSGGMDRVVKVWKYSERGDHTSGELKLTLDLYGHKGIIDSVEVDGRSKRILTASSDGAVGLWSTSKSSAPEADAALLPGSYSNKRRKLTSSVSTAQRGPLSLLPIHSAPASAAVFDPNDRTVAYSVSQDHTVKTIDLTTGTVVSTIQLLNPLLSLCAISRGSSPLLAAGTSARHITIVDPRESATTTSVLTLRGHANKVSSVAAAPDNDYSLVSGSHDGMCKVWDLRDVRPATKDEGVGGSVSEAVITLQRESMRGRKTPITGDGCKVFSVVWDKSLGIVSGGEDKRVQINKYE